MTENYIRGVVQWWHAVLNRGYHLNAFCPTGPGGGVDPTCSIGPHVSEGQRLKVLSDDVVKSIVGKSLREKADKALEQTRRVTQHFEGLATRVKSRAEAKRIAQEFGRSGQGATKEEVLHKLKESIIGRIGAYVRVEA